MVLGVNGPFVVLYFTVVSPVVSGKLDSVRINEHAWCLHLVFNPSRTNVNISVPENIRPHFIYKPIFLITSSCLDGSVLKCLSLCPSGGLL